jgi:choline-sulfatase
MGAQGPVVVAFALALVSACSRSDSGGGSSGSRPAETAGRPTSSAAVADLDGVVPAKFDAAPPTAADGGAVSGGASVKNVILITIDSLRADMPWAGYERPIAPRLTELEKRSVSYTRAYAVSSYTSMSIGGLLASRYPSELKRDGFFFGTYPKENLFFPEILKAAGVRTFAAHAHGYFKDPSFQQGFDKWMLVPNLEWDNTTDKNITSKEHEALFEKLLAVPENTSGRFFAWAHFMDPHDQYLPHAGINYGNKIRDRYDAEVTFTDQYVGKLLDFIAAQPWAAETAIIVSADHGEAFGEHKQFSHGFELWENLVHVPLFFVIPGVTPRRIDQPRSAIDLAPTILELFGMPKDEAMLGRSLIPELRGAPAEARDVITDLPMTSDNDRRRALLRGTKKVIAFGKDNLMQMFDLEADPGELSPISKGDDLKTLADALREASKRIQDVPPYGCKENCLNGAYRKKDGGAK